MILSLSLSQSLSTLRSQNLCNSPGKATIMAARWISHVFEESWDQTSNLFAFITMCKIGQQMFYMWFAHLFHSLCPFTRCILKTGIEKV